MSTIHIAAGLLKNYTFFVYKLGFFVKEHTHMTQVTVRR